MQTADVDVVVGLQFGSEGKGGVCQYLLEQGHYQVTIRTGGPQAGHTVYPSGGVPRAFNVLPAGAVVPGVGLIIPPGCIIDHERLREEISWCEDQGLAVADRLHIDQNATLLEKHHPDAERDEGLVTRVGGTGRGVTAATSDRLWRRARLARDEPALAAFCTDTTTLLSGLGPALIEMTQGYGLSLYTAAAFYPYLTSREISTAQGLAEAGINPRRLRRVYGVARTFPIRAGLDSGPLAGEMPFADLGVEPEFATTTGRPRRIGGWDERLIRRAIEVCGVDRLVLTHIDYLDRSLVSCQDMNQIRETAGERLNSMTDGLGVPVTLLSTAPGKFVDVTPHAAEPSGRTGDGDGARSAR